MERRGRWYRFVILSLLIGIFLELAVIVHFISGDDRRSGNVAVVEVIGVIEDAHETVKILKEHQENDSVKAVVLRVDSPGGAVAASQEIHDSVQNMKSKKPIVVSMANVAASGGYYVSAPATKIVAEPGTLTGSLGVIAHFLILEDLLKRFHLQWEVIKSGENKDIGSVFRPMTDRERKLLQTMTDDIHAQFIEAVANGRKLPLEQVKELADGRVFSGRQAKEKGLVDELGGLEHAISIAAKFARIEGKPKVIYPERERFGWLRQWVEGKIPFSTLRLEYRWQP